MYFDIWNFYSLWKTTANMESQGVYNVLYTIKHQRSKIEMVLKLS